METLLLIGMIALLFAAGYFAADQLGKFADENNRANKILPYFRRNADLFPKKKKTESSGFPRRRSSF